MEYQNKRGGRVVLQDIAKPEKDTWGTAQEAIENALEHEKRLNQAFIDLHDIASRTKDPQMSDFVEEEFLAEEVLFIKKLADFLAGCRLAGPGVGEFLFDKETLEGKNLLEDLS